MKQITFSNVVAVVAILLCFYAFAGENKVSTNEEKEYCILRTNTVQNIMTISYTDGRYEEINMGPYIKETRDYSMIKPTTKKIGEIAAEGWVLKENSTSIISGYTGNDQYVFERNK